MNNNYVTTHSPGRMCGNQDQYDAFTTHLRNGETVLLYIPSAEFPYVRVSEGTGDNLLSRDVAAGYVDYLNLEAFRLHIEIADDTGDFPPGFDYMDGGMALLKESVQEMEGKPLIDAVFEQYAVKSGSDFVVLDTVL